MKKKKSTGVALHDPSPAEVQESRWAREDPQAHAEADQADQNYIYVSKISETVLSSRFKIKVSLEVIG